MDALLERIRASTALIAPIVAGFSDEEREFFQGFVNEAAASVAMELSHYDAHPDYQLDVLPEELRTLDDRREWDWLARLYLIEQYHQMIDTGAVEVQRDGEHYWIDPVELTDTNGVVMGEIILAGVAAAGRFSKATSGGLSTAGARTASSPMPASRPVVAPTSITGYTKHGLERVMNKDGVGVSPAAVRDAVRYPTLVEYQAKNDTYIYVGSNADGRPQPGRSAGHGLRDVTNRLARCRDDRCSQMRRCSERCWLAMTRRCSSRSSSRATPRWPSASAS